LKHLSVRLLFPLQQFQTSSRNYKKTARLTLGEQGGSLVWFFSNRGEQLQLYGCYTTPEDNAMPRQINHCVRKSIAYGQVGSIHLIMPSKFYSLLITSLIGQEISNIIYRPGIDRLRNSIYLSDWDDALSQETDSGISSLAHRSSSRRDQSPTVLSQKQNIQSTENLDGDRFDDVTPLFDLRLWKRTDMSECCFRLIGIIENSFQCLYIARDNIWDILRPFGQKNDLDKKVSLRAYVPQAWQALGQHPVRMLEKAISLMEEYWTGKDRYVSWAIGARSELGVSAPESESLVFGSASRNGLMSYIVEVSPGWRIHQTRPVNITPGTKESVESMKMWISRCHGNHPNYAPFPSHLRISVVRTRTLPSNQEIRRTITLSRAVVGEARRRVRQKRWISHRG
jgi:hypothetical protein